MKKILFLMLIFYSSSFLLAQEEKMEITPFKLTVRIREFANSLAGDLEYVLMENKLEINRYSVIPMIKGIEVSQELGPNKTLQQFSNLDLGIFEEVYDNERVLIISGQMILITYERGNQTNEMMFHCYYSKLLDKMATLFNELIPLEYKIDVCMVP